MRDVVVVEVLVLEDSELLFSIWKEMRLLRLVFGLAKVFLTCCDDDKFIFEFCIKEAAFCLLFLLNFSNRDGGIVSLVSAIMLKVAEKRNKPFYKKYPENCRHFVKKLPQFVDDKQKINLFIFFWCVYV